MIKGIYKNLQIIFNQKREGGREGERGREGGREKEKGIYKFLIS